MARMPRHSTHLHCVQYVTSYTTTGLCSWIVKVCGKSPVDSQKDASAPSTAAHGGCRGSMPVLVASLGQTTRYTRTRKQKDVIKEKATERQV